MRTGVSLHPVIWLDKTGAVKVGVVTVPLVQGRHHQSHCMWCGLGCWLCPAARWPGFDWEAVTQTGAVDTGRGREVTAYRHSYRDRHSYLVLPSRLGVPVIVSLLLASSWDFSSGTIWQNDGNYFPFIGGERNDGCQSIYVYNMKRKRLNWGLNLFLTIHRGEVNTYHFTLSFNLGDWKLLFVIKKRALGRKETDLVSRTKYIIHWVVWALGITKH